ncbi:MAG: MFS transporter, partial [Betaproteobacteria bacterium]|nr:MFS transporter [Betaproteobacteria bacterium]
LLKRFGARLWIARIMVTWGVVSSLMMFMTGEQSFYVMRFILGLAEAGFFPGVIYYLTLWYPSRQRGTRTAGFVAAIALAGVIGNPLSGAVMDLFSGALGLAGWQWLFLIEGIPSILVGIWVIYYLDSGIHEAKWLSDEEKAVLTKALAAEERHKAHSTLSHAFTSGRVWLLSAIYFTLMVGLYGIAFWLPTLVKAFGVKGYLNVGLLSAIPYGVCIVGMTWLSRRSDRTGERRIHYVLNVTVGALGLVGAGLFASNPAVSILCLSLATLGVVGSMPLFWPMPSAFLTGTAAAAGIGIVNSVGNLGGYFGPNIPVWMKQVSANPSAALYAIAAVLMVGALLVLLFIPASVNVPRPRD